MWRGQLRSERVSRVVWQCLPVSEPRYICHALFSPITRVAVEVYFLNTWPRVTHRQSLSSSLHRSGFVWRCGKSERSPASHVPDIIRCDTEWRGLESHCEDNLDTISQHSRDRAKIQTISSTAWHYVKTRNPSLCHTLCNMMAACNETSSIMCKHSQIPEELRKYTSTARRSTWKLKTEKISRVSDLNWSPGPRHTRSQQTHRKAN